MDTVLQQVKTSLGRKSVKMERQMMDAPCRGYEITDGRVFHNLNSSSVVECITGGLTGGKQSG